MWDDGIFKVGNRYTKTFRFDDINYAVASREDKEAMFLEYSELLNSLDSGVTTKITINNHCRNRADFEHQFLYEHLIKEVDGSERVDRRAEIINRILGNYGDGIGKKNVNNRNTVERGSDSGNAAVYRRNSRNRPSEALLNCLRNIAKISDTDGADLNERSAFSMPENDDVEYSFEDDVVDKTSSLAERVRLGEISQTEYLNELQRLMDEATEKYGAIPKGENPKVDVTVPKQVSDKRNTRRKNNKKES